MIRFHMYNRVPAYVQINYVDCDEDDFLVTDHQITKQGMSSRVVDEQNVEKQFSSSEIVSNAENYEMVSSETVPTRDENSWKNTIPEIDDAVLRAVLESHSDLLTAAPFTHESLLIENKNERLTQEEKMLAKKSYQFEKQMNKGFGGFSNTYSKILAEHGRIVNAVPKTSNYGPPLRSKSHPPRTRSPPLMANRLILPARDRDPTSGAHLTPSPPPYHAWNSPTPTGKVTEIQRNNMQVAAPYLMTFKNPTNPYFDEEARQIIRQRAARPSDLRKRKRNDELCQQAISSGTFDFDGLEIHPTVRGGMGSSASGRGVTVVDLLEVEDDNLQPMEIPIASVVSRDNGLGEVRASGSVTRTGIAPENQIVLVSDSD